MEMYRCSIGALLEEAGGPRESEIPHGFREGIAKLELLRTEAALQKPEPNTEEELNDRWSSLHRERLRALGTWRWWRRSVAASSPTLRNATGGTHRGGSRR
jgi:hypothetical protein